MKNLHFDCGMGAAGDMMTAALLELLPEPERFAERFNALGIPGVELLREPGEKCGIRGSRVRILIHGTEESPTLYEGQESAHRHTSLAEIRAMIERLPLADPVKRDIRAVYELLAQAESAVHAVPVTQIHFHEVGTMDALADVTAVCMLMHELKPDTVTASAVHVGSGMVRCAHGLLPVPAPATAWLLKGVPIYGGKINGELCTPTGAALLKHFVMRFGEMPPMSVSALGCGLGKKDFEAANCLRVFYGETADKSEDVLELDCNVDDMTAEEIAFACERLYDFGAREVYTVPISMKKGRPGTLIRVLCAESERERLLPALFKYTTTIGVRESYARRHVLPRRVEELDTPYGILRRKVSAGYGAETAKLEYEDLKRIALEQDLSLRQVRALLQGLI